MTECKICKEYFKDAPHYTEEKRLKFHNSITHKQWELDDTPLVNKIVAEMMRRREHHEQTG